ncbi:MAG: ATP-grasp domain-containing protein [Rhodospirillales bacterium]|nr:ATP-grasp domain-containing protein [Rhodospirillales bacterium]
MKKCPRVRIVIVDGYSTGRELLRELLEREVECFHLRSSRDLPDAVSACFDPRPYDGDLGHLGSVAQAAEALRSLNPDLVVAGSEWGVSFAERLAAQLGLPTNRRETTAARRDKFEMIEAVRRRKLLAPQQAAIGNVAEAVAWATAHDTWPVIVKPLDSAGSDGVTACRSLQEVAAAATRELGRRNFMGCVNDRVLLQSYLPGPQFIVNTVSWGGAHYVTDVWSMTVGLRDGSVVPGGIHLCDPQGMRTRSLIAYTLETIDALGIENGPAHTELKWTPDGPALIETGARLMGAAMDEPSYTAAGMRTQAKVFADVIAGCAHDRAAILAERQFRMRRHMSKVLFNFAQDGVIAHTAGLERLRSLRSFHAHYRALPAGSRVWRTSDWLACGGVIYLVHDDAGQIASDIETIRCWEQAGALYAVTPSRPLALTA